MSFYTYIHARPDADVGGVFYVGKGTRSRAFDFTRRNMYHQHLIDKHGSDSIGVGLLECSGEDIALSLEKGLIKCLKRMGVNLANMTEGGEGVSGYRHTEAARKAMSEKRSGRKPSAETKAKMSKSRSGEKNGFYGKRHTEASKAKVSEGKKQNPTRYWLGQKRSEEVCKKISAALKESWRKRKQSDFGEQA